MHGDGVGDMDWCCDVGLRVGGDHTPEQGGGKATGQGGIGAHRLDILRECLAPVGCGLFCGLRITGGIMGKASGLGCEPCQFWRTKQQGLAAGFALVGLVAVDGFLKRRVQFGQHVFGNSGVT